MSGYIKYFEFDSFEGHMGFKCNNKYFQAEANSVYIIL